MKGLLRLLIIKEAVVRKMMEARKKMPQPLDHGGLDGKLSCVGTRTKNFELSNM